MLEDSADLAGIALAFAGVFLSSRYGLVWADGAASIAIGIIMASLAVFLMVETHGLLIGEAATEDLRRLVRGIATRADRIVSVERPVTMQLGPDAVLVGLDVAFEPDATAQEIAVAIEHLEDGIKRERPEVRFLYIEAQSLRARRPQPGADSAGALRAE